MSDSHEDDYVIVRLPLRLRVVELEQIREAAERQGKLGQSGRPAEPTRNETLIAQRNYAAHLLRVRRRREQELGADFFADPAWDMLLDLFIRHVDGKRTCVSSACIGSCVPPTTALRYLTMLENGGMIAREPAPDDGRRVFITLTDDTFIKMQRLLTG